MTRYKQERRKLFRSLADHAHDKALSVNCPISFARWAVFMDCCLWCADPDAETDTMQFAIKEMQA